MQQQVVQDSSGSIVCDTPWSGWDARQYLQTYFSTLGQDSYFQLRFLAEEMQQLSGRNFGKVLDFGAGPTILGAMIAAPYTREVHIADYLESNFGEIEKWLHDAPDAFDWDDAIRFVLKSEKRIPSALNLSIRKLTIKKTVTKIFRCDASLANPLLHVDGEYPLVISSFCPDSATDSKDIWRNYMSNISNLVASDGVLMIASLRQCQHYKCGTDYFPSANINEHDLAQSLLENGFSPNQTRIEVYETPECAAEGFTSIMCARCIKNGRAD